MKKHFFTMVAVAAFLLTTHYSLLTDGIVFAQPADPKKVYERIGQGVPPITQLSGIGQASVENIFVKLLSWMITVFWIVTVGFLIWAAFTFLTANGEEDKITLAKKRVQYAVIAAAIALLSTGINVIVYYLLGGS